MREQKIQKHVAIIGAGPSGLFAAFQCGLLGMNAVVIDALPQIGGQCMALYPEKPIYDVAGLPNVLAGDLIRNLEAQAAPFDPVYLLNQTVIDLNEDKDGDFHLVTNTGQEIIAKAVIIAAGPGAFGPNRPPLDNVKMYEPNHVHYMVANPQCFKDQNLVIAGGGDSAIDWVNTLKDIAKSITLVHRRDKFRAAPASLTQMNTAVSAGRVVKKVPYQLKGLTGDGCKLNSVQITSIDGTDTQDISCDHLLCFYGLKQDLGALRDWSLDIEGYQIVIDPTTGQTNRKGIYAVGDIASYPHKLKLISTGFAEVAQTAHHAYGLVFPNQTLHFEYSTTKGVPQETLQSEKEA